MTSSSKKPSILLIKPILKGDYLYLCGLTDELSKYFELTCLFGNNLLYYPIEKGYKIKIFSNKIKKNNKWNNLCRLFVFTIKVIIFIYKNKFDIYYIHGNKLNFFLPFFFPRRKFVYQLVTSSVSKSPIRRWRDDSLKKFNLYFMKYIIVKTKWVADFYNLPKSKVFETVGAWGFNEILETNTVNIENELKLVYVGTFNNRNIFETIEGIRIYLDRNPSVNVRYILMGYGSEEETKRLLTTIEKMKLEEQVRFVGFGDEYKIKKYFSECNVGISYVPIVEYYNNVLVTKTYEYILSGLPVIATQTNENKKIVNDTNGVLINDTPEDFCKGLELLYKRKKGYNSQKIKSTLSDFTYKNKVKNEYVPIFMKILGKET